MQTWSWESPGRYQGEERRGECPRWAGGSVPVVGHRDSLQLQTFRKTQNLPPKEWGGQEFTSCLWVTWGCSLGFQLSCISNLTHAETEHAPAMACRLIGAVSWGKNQGTDAIFPNKLGTGWGHKSEHLQHLLYWWTCDSVLVNKTWGLSA